MSTQARIIAIAAAVIAAAMLAGPGEAPVARAEAGGDVERARAHFATGKSLFENGLYRDALAAFSRADEIVPSPINRYNIALCHDRLGDDEAALRAYRDYLEAVPDAPNRRDVEARISALEETAETPPDPSPDRSSTREEADAPAAERDAEPSSRPPADEGAAPDPDRDRGGDAKRPHEPEPGAPAETGRGHTPAGDRGGPGAVGPPAEGDGGREERPLYKSWWFWGVAGVSALILFNIATASSDGTSSLEVLEPTPSSGATLWRF